AAIMAKAGDRERTIEYIRRSLAIDPEDSTMLYNIACAYALLGMSEEAVSSLETAVDRGFGHKEWIEHDTDFDSLRNTPRFQAIAQAM
ncbi:MAG: adenylate/guanylate cyclase domain-containing protein, partial [Gemmatimonadaceae bacterium]